MPFCNLFMGRPSYLRCKTTVLAFTLSVTVMLLLTDETSALDDKSVGIEYCQKYVKKVSPTDIDTAYEKHCRYLRQYSKRIAYTIGSNTNTVILTTLINTTVHSWCECIVSCPIRHKT